MFKDRFDKLCLALSLASLAAIVVLLVVSQSEPGKKQAAGLGKAAEREQAYRARVELIGTLYGPVEALRKAGQTPQALLRLDELLRKYPAEAHGYILQGELLSDSGARDEALAAFVQGVKLNGEYLDVTSPLSRRAAIASLVAESQKRVAAGLDESPSNQSLQALQSKINYLKSRLAGGCE